MTYNYVKRPQIFVAQIFQKEKITHTKLEHPRTIYFIGMLPMLPIKKLNLETNSSF